MSTIVKICGLTSPADALAAAEAGADAIGLMFYEKSPRHITLATAAKIVRELPPHVIKVGVFVNPSEDHVRRAITELGLQMVQFHGDEPPEFCLLFPIFTIKAFRVASMTDSPDCPAAVIRRTPGFSTPIRPTNSAGRARSLTGTLRSKRKPWAVLFSLPAA